MYEKITITLGEEVGEGAESDKKRKITTNCLQYAREKYVTRVGVAESVRAAQDLASRYGQTCGP